MTTFEQTVPLHVIIRTILDNYPEGTNLLKEFIQNADDAGASVLRVCLDKRTHLSASLPSENLAPFQGPSLLIFNDAVFRDPDDFNGIKQPMHSVKAADVTQTGRYGQGFNVVYHYTDLPTIVSGSKIVTLDPQREFLPGSKPGIERDLSAESDQRYMETYPDFFSPLCAFGFDLAPNFNNTLFRLPLRSEKLANRSSSKKVSRTSQSVDSMEAQLLEFEKIVPLCLLFSKSLTAVEFSVWNEDDDRMTVFFECTCVLSGEDRAQRQLIPSSLKKIHSESLGRFPDLTSDVYVEIESVKTVQHAGDSLKLSEFLLCNPEAPPSQSQQRSLTVCMDCVGKAERCPECQAANRKLSPPGLSLSTTAEEKKRSKMKFLVCSNLGGTEATKFANKHWSGPDNLRFVPFASVAFEIQDPSIPFKGQAFCCLPLPLPATGLPVHINCPFELSNDRRSIFKEVSGEDLKNKGLFRAKWNHIVLEHVAVPAYLRLLNLLKNDRDRQKQLWPVASNPQWEKLCCDVFSGSVDMDVLYSCGSNEWVSPRKSIFLQSQMFLGDDSMKQIVLNILKGMRANIIDYPENIIQRFEKLRTDGFNPQYFDHKLFCNLLKEKRHTLSFEDAERVLPFLFSSKYLKSPDFERVISLGILPVFRNKTVIAVPGKSDPKPCVLVTESIIDIVARSDLLHAVVGWKRVEDTFTSKAFQDLSGIRMLMPCDMPIVLHGFFGIDCDKMKEVSRDDKMKEVLRDGLVKDTELKRLWSEVLIQGDNWVSKCSNWPIFPTSKKTLMDQDSASLCLMSTATATYFSDIRELLLDHFDFRELDHSITIPEFCCINYTIKTSASILLQSLITNFNLNGQLESIPGMGPENIVKLRRFFLKHVNRLDASSKTDLLKLRIHSCYRDDTFYSLDCALHRFPPRNVHSPESLLKKSNIFVKTDSQEEIASYELLQIPRLRNVVWYKEHVLSCERHDHDIRVLVLNMLQQLPQLCQEDPTFEGYLRGLKFLSNRKETPMLVSDLYDPNDSSRWGIRRSDEEYPADDFKHVLVHLQRLGLKRDSFVTGIVYAMRGWKFIWLSLMSAYDGFHVGIIMYSVFNLYSATQNSSNWLSTVPLWLVLAAECLRYIVIIFNIAYIVGKEVMRSPGKPNDPDFSPAFLHSINGATAGNCFFLFAAFLLPTNELWGAAGKSKSVEQIERLELTQESRWAEKNPIFGIPDFLSFFASLFALYVLVQGWIFIPEVISSTNNGGITIAAMASAAFFVAGHMYSLLQTLLRPSTGSNSLSLSAFTIFLGIGDFIGMLITSLNMFDLLSAYPNTSVHRVLIITCCLLAFFRAILSLLYACRCGAKDAKGPSSIDLINSSVGNFTWPIVIKLFPLHLKDYSSKINRYGSSVWPAVIRSISFLRMFLLIYLNGVSLATIVDTTAFQRIAVVSIVCAIFDLIAASYMWMFFGIWDQIEESNRENSSLLDDAAENTLKEPLLPRDRTEDPKCLTKGSEQYLWFLKNWWWLYTMSIVDLSSLVICLVNITDIMDLFNGNLRWLVALLLALFLLRISGQIFLGLRSVIKCRKKENVSSADWEYFSSPQIPEHPEHEPKMFLSDCSYNSCVCFMTWLFCPAALVRFLLKGVASIRKQRTHMPITFLNVVTVLKSLINVVVCFIAFVNLELSLVQIVVLTAALMLSLLRGLISLCGFLRFEFCDNANQMSFKNFSLLWTGAFAVLVSILASMFSQPCSFVPQFCRTDPSQCTDQHCDPTAVCLSNWSNNYSCACPPWLSGDGTGSCSCPSSYFSVPNFDRKTCVVGGLFMSLGDMTSVVSTSICLILTSFAWFYEWNHFKEKVFSSNFKKAISLFVLSIVVIGVSFGVFSSRHPTSPNCPSWMTSSGASCVCPLSDYPVPDFERGVCVTSKYHMSQGQVVGIAMGALVSGIILISFLIFALKSQYNRGNDFFCYATVICMIVFALLYGLVFGIGSVKFFPVPKVACGNSSASYKLCDVNAGCLEGVCSCNAGFIGDGAVCIAGAEGFCSYFLNQCDVAATCNPTQSTEAAHSCSCPSWMKGEGYLSLPCSCPLSDYPVPDFERGVCVTSKYHMSQGQVVGIAMGALVSGIILIWGPMYDRDPKFWTTWIKISLILFALLYGLVFGIGSVKFFPVPKVACGNSSASFKLCDVNAGCLAGVCSCNAGFIGDGAVCTVGAGPIPTAHPGALTTAAFTTAAQTSTTAAPISTASPTISSSTSSPPST